MNPQLENKLKDLDKMFLKNKDITLNEHILIRKKINEILILHHKDLEYSTKQKMFENLRKRI